MNRYFPLVLLLLASSAQARTIYFGTEPEDINIFHGGPTLFRFEKPVKTITRAGNFIIQPADARSPDYATLTVEPRAPSGVDQVVFILTDGSTIKTRLLIVPTRPKSPSDAVYEFKAKDSLLEGGNPAGTPLVGKLDLLKGLIRGDFVAGYKIEKRDQSIHTGLDGIEATLVRVYLGKDAHGYVYRLTNRTANQTYEIDLRKLRLGDPNLALLSEVSRERLEGKRTGRNVAYLHIIAKPASLFRSITLPVRWVEKGKK